MSTIISDIYGSPSFGSLLDRLEEMRSQGHRIVTTNGCFDLLHRGHIAYLDEARQQGDTLLVLLNTDRSVRQLKGVDRPIQSEEDRSAMLLALRSVDGVILLDDLLPNALLDLIRPDVHCKGGDYAPADMPETPVVESHGGEVRILPFLPGYSTTSLIDRIMDKMEDNHGFDHKHEQVLSDRQKVCQFLLNGSSVLRRTAYHLRQPIVEVADQINEAIRTGHKVLVCGNGGSAGDAQHFAAELVGRYRLDRKGWPAIALTTDTSALTAISNDYGFDQVFARQVAALGREGDILIGISTSGRSPNVINAVEQANLMGLRTIGLVGDNTESELSNVVQVCLHVPSTEGPMIQQAHIAVVHAICELLEEKRI